MPSALHRLARSPGRWAAVRSRGRSRIRASTARIGQCRNEGKRATAAARARAGCSIGRSTRARDGNGCRGSRRTGGRSWKSPSRGGRRAGRRPVHRRGPACTPRRVSRRHDVPPWLRGAQSMCEHHLFDGRGVCQRSMRSRSVRGSDVQYRRDVRRRPVHRYMPLPRRLPGRSSLSRRTLPVPAQLPGRWQPGVHE